MSDIQSDYLQCETLIDELLSHDQRYIIDGCPVWGCEPPQRESYDTPRDYVLALRDYADRVIYSQSSS